MTQRMPCAFVTGMDERAVSPVVVELVGVAGAGKSSIASALVARDGALRARPPVSRRLYWATVPALLPTFLSLHWPPWAPRGVLTKEMKRILRVQALHRLVRSTTDGRTILFDEGPVYMLARILVFGGERIRTHAFARWWRSAIAQWAQAFAAIIWFDASDDVLASRLHTRRQWHPLRGAPDQTVRAFFASYRDAFRRVLADLEAAGGPQPWIVATDRPSVERTAQAVLARLHSLRETVIPIPEMA